jgi:hypothetical protein
MVCGFFMIGFPTETPEELRATVDFALESRLSMAQFFQVTPQPQTPLYDLALSEGAEALAAIVEDEKQGGCYRNAITWYERTYGFPLAQFRRQAYRDFYLRPRRMWRLWNRVPSYHSLFQGVGGLLGNLLGRAQPHALGYPKPPVNWPYRGESSSPGARYAM